jgi:hypothetical protein
MQNKFSICSFTTRCNFQHFELIEYVNKFMIMDNIKCRVVLLMSLQMWTKLNQYYHIYHVMKQQYVCSLDDILSTNQLICKKMFIQIW